MGVNNVFKTAELAFAAQKLGLLPPPSSYSPAGAYLGLKTGELAVSLASISFELPKINNTPVSGVGDLLVYDLKDKLIKKRPLVLSEPLGDVAEMSVAEKSSALYARTGLRLALKHITAIVAAYGTYRALKGKDRSNDFFAKQAAVIQYAASTKTIEATEKADLRYWSTLPHNIRLSHVQLPVGKYRVKVKLGKKLINLGEVALKGRSQEFLHKRVF